MKILHIFDHSVPYFSGYTFRSNYIISNQRKLGFDPVVLTSLKHEKYGPSETVIDGLKFYRTPPFSNPLTRTAFNMVLIGECMHMIRLYHRIVEILQKERFDLIHAHSPALNGFPAMRAARRLGIPFVYEIRAFWEDAGVDLGSYTSEKSLKYKSVRRFETHLCRKADHVTTICEGLKNDLLGRDISSKKITVIPNGVESDSFLPLERNTGLMKKLGLEPGKVLGFIGSFYDYEGLDILVKAFAIINKKRSDLKLLMVGSGYQGQHEKLKSLCSSLGLDSNITFTGRVHHSDVNSYYSVIDIFIYPRRSMRITELVTPLKPLEAMSMEKIVLGSSVGGIAELVENGMNGFLFKPDDEASLADTVLEVVDKTENLDSMGARARKYVRENRDWDKIVKRYEKVYASAAANCRSRK